MSYILHVWEHPKASSLSRPEQASQFLDVACGINTGQNPKYIAFAQTITAQYPDLDSMEDEEDEEDVNVWADSPIDGRTERAVYTLGVLSDRFDSRLRWSIVQAAYDQGLHVFDMQEGVLYCPDWTYIEMGGAHYVSVLQRFDREGPDADSPERCVASIIGGLSVSQAAQQLIDMVSRFHPPVDFMPFVPEPVKKRVCEMTATLPACADDLLVFGSGRFDTRGMAEEEIAEKRKQLQREQKQRLFDTLTAIHRYFHD